MKKRAHRTADLPNATIARLLEQRYARLLEPDETENLQHRIAELKTPLTEAVRRLRTRKGH